MGTYAKSPDLLSLRSANQTPDGSVNKLGESHIKVTEITDKESILIRVESGKAKDGKHEKFTPRFNQPVLAAAIKLERKDTEETELKHPRGQTQPGRGKSLPSLPVRQTGVQSLA